MSSVRIDADAMRDRASQLYGEARNVGAVMESLGNLSASLQDEWAGEESEAFAEWYLQEFRPNLIDGQVAIGKFADAIGACADDLAREARGAAESGEVE